MSKRYGKLPSEITKQNCIDFDFDILVCSEALKEEAKIAKDEARKAKQRRNRRPRRFR